MSSFSLQFLRSSEHCFSICNLQFMFLVKGKFILHFVYIEDWLQSWISPLLVDDPCRSHGEAAAPEGSFPVQPQFRAQSFAA